MIGNDMKIELEYESQNISIVDKPMQARNSCKTLALVFNFPITSEGIIASEFALNSLLR